MARNLARELSGLDREGYEGVADCRADLMPFSATSGAVPRTAAISTGKMNFKT